MEAQDLIYLVSCAVNGVTPDAERVAGMDLDAIYKLASCHMLAATVSPALKAAGVSAECHVPPKPQTVRRCPYQPVQPADFPPALIRADRRKLGQIVSVILDPLQIQQNNHHKYSSSFSAL